MKFLNENGRKVEYLENSNFKLLFEKEVNMCDSNNNSALMYLCKYNPHLLNHSVFTTMLIQ